jgi:hypothetical protein
MSPDISHVFALQARFLLLVVAMTVPACGELSEVEPDLGTLSDELNGSPDIQPVEAHCEIACAPIPSNCHREGERLSGPCSAVTCGKTVCVDPSADLIIHNFSVNPAHPRPRELVHFIVRIKNEGSATAPGCHASLKVGGETDPQIYTIPSLAPGATYTFVRNERFPWAMEFRATLVVDPYAEVVESNERNNQSSLDFSVRE